MDRNPVSLLRAVLATSGGTRGKDKNEVPVMRSDLKPWIPPRQLEELKREALRKAPKTAEHFIPRMSYDTMFAALRHVIFKIDRKSATPIAHIIYDSCTDAELSELSSGVCPIGGRDLYLYELWWQQAESKKLKHPPYARLRAKIEEAREHHSRQLREHGYEDVDITYWSGEANYTFMKADEIEIKKSVSPSLSLCFCCILTVVVGWEAISYLVSPRYHNAVPLCFSDDLRSACC